MKVLFASSEAYPFILSGGLADVSASLPIALKNEDVDCRVVIPLYSCIDYKILKGLKLIGYFNVDVPWRRQHCRMFETSVNGVTYYLLENEHYFNRRGIYGFYDDAERFAFFSRAVIEMVKHIDFVPDIIHSNNWQTALIPVYLKLLYNNDSTLNKIKTVFTIHNIMFQGKFSMDVLEDVFGLSDEYKDVVLYDKCINLMKAAVMQADMVSTVSPSYSKEILDPWFANGLDEYLYQNKDKITGILNGIDTDLYDPNTDSAIYFNYSANDISGKLKNKKRLLQDLGLLYSPDIMTVGVITSFIESRGIELIRYGIEELMKLNIQLIFLGNGNYYFEEFLTKLTKQYPGRVSVNIKTDPLLSRKIYAGVDAVLMPSKTEPCGLLQMVALRYGTLPIVRETGGLKDSIIDFNKSPEIGNGYSFKTYNASDMVSAVNRAVCDFTDGLRWKKQVARAMECDFSWRRSAKLYVKMYKETLHL